MHPIRRLEPSFVQHLPEVLEPGRIYVSIDFASTAHLCCCGCQSEVIAPLSPTDWKLTYDGVNVSLHPSIGNWSLACRSHYVVRNGKVRWADEWSEEKVARGRRNDQAAKNRYFSDDEKAPHPDADKPAPPTRAEPKDTGIVAKLLDWLRT